MNPFRLIGDMSHLAGILILLHKIYTSRSCAGISLKTQIIYLTVFCCRYLDLFTNFVSFYNTTMKIFFIGSSAGIIYLMTQKYKVTYSKDNDTIPLYFIFGPTFVLSLIANYKFTPTEILWAFSEYTEALAIFPQLDMIQQTGEAESITSHYIFAMGVYRGMYIPNWIYRWVYEGHVDWISVISGIVQTVLYCDFFYLYMTKVLAGRKLVLPA